MLIKKFKYCLVVFIMIFYRLECSSDLSITLSQAYNNDYASGERSSLDMSVIYSLKEQILLYGFDININSKISIGGRYEDGTKVMMSQIVPTDNEIFGELVFKYPVGWLLDPYISFNTRTQVTESINIFNNTKTVSGKMRDPITTQESFGFAYNLKDSTFKNDIRLGISLMQIRADRYTQMTDDPFTPYIREKYKVKTGIDINNTFNYKIDAATSFSSRLALFGDFEDLNIWLIRFENDLNMKIWDFFGILIRMNFLYDHNQLSKLQIQQSFRVGVLTRF